MSQPSESPTPSRLQTERLQIEPWRIAVRWQEYDGELRVCFLRMLAVALFYGLYLVQYVASKPSEAALGLHPKLTMIAALWLFVSLGTLMLLRARCLPSTMKYITTAIDLALVTAVCWIGHGPSSPMVLAYFLVIAMAALRFRSGLIAMATAGSVVGYMACVGSRDTTWGDSEHVTPVLNQLLTVAALVAVGWILVQVLWVAQQVACAYQQRSDRLEEPS
ncbi:MAG: hypothetical protein ACK5OB_09335 [Pirellula sp.]